VVHGQLFIVGYPGADKRLAWCGDQRSQPLFIGKAEASVRRVVRDQDVGDRRQRMELIVLSSIQN
jgi:hypothetical protein